jgi:hypothetical protein
MQLLGLYFMVEGKCHYAHQIENLANEHLLTGLMSALTAFYYEIYNENLNFIRLNQMSIKITRMDDFEIIMMYRSEVATDDVTADNYLCRVLEEFCVNQMIDTSIDMINQEQEMVFMQLVTEIAAEVSV